MNGSSNICVNVKMKLLIFPVIILYAIIDVATSEHETQCTVNGKRAIHKVDEKFLSISFDPAILFSGIKFGQTTLDLAKHLSPAYLRIAGPSTNYLKFDNNDVSVATIHPESKNLQFGPLMWWTFNMWIKPLNFTPVFGLPDTERVDGNYWDEKSCLQLLNFTSKMNVDCSWQLGYDHTELTENQYIKDLKNLRNILEAFPSSNYSWKAVGSDLSVFGVDRDISKKLIESIEDADAVMWEPVEDENDDVKQDPMHKFLNIYEPSLPIWTSAPKDDHPVNFQTGINWAYRIGQSARDGFDVVFRQPRLQEFFAETPVYWVSLLHKHLMGRNVLDVKSSIFSSTEKEAFVYAHCSKNQNSYTISGAMTILVVNNGTQEHQVALKVAGTQMKSVDVRSFVLTSPHVNSGDTYLNGEKLTIKHLTTSFQPKLRRAKATTHLTLMAAAKSIAFFVLPSARIPVCLSQEDETHLILQEISRDQELEFPDPQEAADIKLESRFSARKPSESLKDVFHRMEKEISEDEKVLKRIRIKPAKFKLGGERDVLKMLSEHLRLGAKKVPKLQLTERTKVDNEADEKHILKMLHDKAKESIDNLLSKVQKREINMALLDKKATIRRPDQTSDEFMSEETSTEKKHLFPKNIFAGLAPPEQTEETIFPGLIPQNKRKHKDLFLPFFGLSATTKAPKKIAPTKKNFLGYVKEEDDGGEEDFDDFGDDLGYHTFLEDIDGDVYGQGKRYLRDEKHLWDFGAFDSAMKSSHEALAPEKCGGKKCVLSPARSKSQSGSGQRKKNKVEAIANAKQEDDSSQPEINGEKVDGNKYINYWNLKGEEQYPTNNVPDGLKNPQRIIQEDGEYVNFFDYLNAGKSKNIDDFEDNPREASAKEINRFKVASPNELGRFEAGRKDFDEFGEGGQRDFDEFGEGGQKDFDEFGEGGQKDFDEFGEGGQKYFYEFGEGGQKDFNEFGEGGAKDFHELSEGGEKKIDEFGEGGQKDFHVFGEGGQKFFDEFGEGGQKDFDEFGEGAQKEFNDFDDEFEEPKKLQVEDSENFPRNFQGGPKMENPRNFRSEFKSFKEAAKDLRTVEKHKNAPKKSSGSKTLTSYPPSGFKDIGDLPIATKAAKKLSKAKTLTKPFNDPPIGLEDFDDLASAPKAVKKSSEAKTPFKDLPSSLEDFDDLPRASKPPKKLCSNLPCSHPLEFERFQQNPNNFRAFDQNPTNFRRIFEVSKEDLDNFDEEMARDYAELPPCASGRRANVQCFEAPKYDEEFPANVPNRKNSAIERQLWMFGDDVVPVEKKQFGGMGGNAGDEKLFIINKSAKEGVDKTIKQLEDYLNTDQENTEKPTEDYEAYFGRFKRGLYLRPYRGDCNQNDQYPGGHNFRRGLYLRPHRGDCNQNNQYAGRHKFGKTTKEETLTKKRSLQKRDENSHQDFDKSQYKHQIKFLKTRLAHQKKHEEELKKAQEERQKLEATKNKEAEEEIVGGKRQFKKHQLKLLQIPQKNGPKKLPGTKLLSRNNFGFHPRKRNFFEIPNGNDPNFFHGAKFFEGNGGRESLGKDGTLFNLSGRRETNIFGHNPIERRKGCNFAGLGKRLGRRLGHKNDFYPESEVYQRKHGFGNIFRRKKFANHLKYRRNVGHKQLRHRRNVEDDGLGTILKSKGKTEEISKVSKEEAEDSKDIAEATKKFKKENHLKIDEIPLVQSSETAKIFAQNIQEELQSKSGEEESDVSTKTEKIKGFKFLEDAMNDFETSTIEEPKNDDEETHKDTKQKQEKLNILLPESGEEAEKSVTYEVKVKKIEDGDFKKLSQTELKNEELSKKLKEARKDELKDPDEEYLSKKQDEITKDKLDETQKDDKYLNETQKDDKELNNLQKELSKKLDGILKAEEYLSKKQNENHAKIIKENVEIQKNDEETKKLIEDRKDESTLKSLDDMPEDALENLGIIRRENEEDMKILKDEGKIDINLKGNDKRVNEETLGEIQKEDKEDTKELNSEKIAKKLQDEESRDKDMKKLNEGFFTEDQNGDEKIAKKLKEEQILNESLEKDEILHENLGKDEILHESQGKDEILNESLGKDEILHESQRKDEILHESLGKDEILHETPGKDEILNDSQGKDEISQEKDKNNTNKLKDDETVTTKLQEEHTNQNHKEDEEIAKKTKENLENTEEFEEVIEVPKRLHFSTSKEEMNNPKRVSRSLKDDETPKDGIILNDEDMITLQEIFKGLGSADEIEETTELKTGRNEDGGIEMKKLQEVSKDEEDMKKSQGILKNNEDLKKGQNILGAEKAKLSVNEEKLKDQVLKDEEELKKLQGISKDEKKFEELTKDGKKFEELTKYEKKFEELNGKTFKELTKDEKKFKELNGKKFEELTKDGKKSEELIKDGKKFEELNGKKFEELTKDEKKFEELAKDGKKFEELNGKKSEELTKDGKKSEELTKDGKKFEELTKDEKFEELTKDGKMFEEFTKDWKKFGELTKVGKKSEELTKDGKKFEELTKDGKKFEELTKDWKKFGELTKVGKKSEESTKDGKKFEELTKDGKKFEELTKDEKKFEELTKDMKKLEELTKDNEELKRPKDVLTADVTLENGETKNLPKDRMKNEGIPTDDEEMKKFKGISNKEQKFDETPKELQENSKDTEEKKKLQERSNEEQKFDETPKELLENSKDKEEKKKLQGASNKEQKFEETLKELQKNSKDKEEKKKLQERSNKEQKFEESSKELQENSKEKKKWQGISKDEETKKFLAIPKNEERLKDDEEKKKLLEVSKDEEMKKLQKDLGDDNKFEETSEESDVLRSDGKMLNGEETKKFLEMPKDGEMLNDEEGTKKLQNISSEEEIKTLQGISIEEKNLEEKEKKKLQENSKDGEETTTLHEISKDDEMKKLQEGLKDGKTIEGMPEDLEETKKFLEMPKDEEEKKKLQEGSKDEETTKLQNILNEEETKTLQGILIEEKEKKKLQENSKDTEEKTKLPRISKDEEMKKLQEGLRDGKTIEAKPENLDQTKKFLEIPKGGEILKDEKGTNKLQENSKDKEENKKFSGISKDDEMKKLQEGLGDGKAIEGTPEDLDETKKFLEMPKDEEEKKKLQEDSKDDEMKKLQEGLGDGKAIEGTPEDLEETKKFLEIPNHGEMLKDEEEKKKTHQNNSSEQFSQKDREQNTQIFKPHNPKEYFEKDSLEELSQKDDDAFRRIYIPRTNLQKSAQLYKSKFNEWKEWKPEDILKLPRMLFGASSRSARDVGKKDSLVANRGHSLEVSESTYKNGCNEDATRSKRRVGGRRGGSSRSPDKKRKHFFASKLKKKNNRRIKRAINSKQTHSNENAYLNEIRKTPKFLRGSDEEKDGTYELQPHKIEKKDSAEKDDKIFDHKAAKKWKLVQLLKRSFIPRLLKLLGYPHSTRLHKRHIASYFDPNDYGLIGNSVVAKKRLRANDLDLFENSILKRNRASDEENYGERSGEYTLILPTKDAIQVISKGGETELKILKVGAGDKDEKFEALKKTPDALFTPLFSSEETEKEPFQETGKQNENSEEEESVVTVNDDDETVTLTADDDVEETSVATSTSVVDDATEILDSSQNANAIGEPIEEAEAEKATPNLQGDEKKVNGFTINLKEIVQSVKGFVDKVHKKIKTMFSR